MIFNKHANLSHQYYIFIIIPREEPAWSIYTDTATCCFRLLYCGTEFHTTLKCFTEDIVLIAACCKSKCYSQKSEDECFFHFFLVI